MPGTRGLDRGDSETADYIHIHFLPVDRGWAWQIPITDEITSVGIVAEREVFRQARKDVEGYFNTYIGSNPALARALAPAERINEFKTEGDYSYKMQTLRGRRLDAGRRRRALRRSDLLFGRQCCDDERPVRYRTAFAVPSRQADFSAATFSPYEEKIRSGVSVWYEFIRLYYKLLPLFTHFVQSEEYNTQIKELLQGIVFDRKDVPVLDAMRNYIKAVEASDNHIFKSQLSTVPID